MRESLNELSQSQIDFTNIQHWFPFVPDIIGGSKTVLHTTTYDPVLNKKDIFTYVINPITKRITSRDLSRPKKMGGSGSGRKGVTKPSTVRKTSSTTKFAAGLSSLGFTNSAKSSTTSSNATPSNDKPSNNDNVAPSIVTPTKDSNVQATASNAFNIGMIPGLTDAITPDKPPVARPMQEQKKTQTTDETAVDAVAYKTQVLYRTKVKTKNINVIEKMKCLMARCYHFDPSLQLYPYDTSNKSNPITTAKDIPNDTETFQAYVPDASVNPRSMMLRMSFKVRSSLKLWQLKAIVGVRNYLRQYNVYLDQTYLVTYDNVKVGGLILAHPQFTRRDVATRDLNRRINEHEDVITPIQLAPSSMWNNQGNKISTKVLAVECAKENAEIVKDRLCSKLLNVPEEMQFSNTRYFKFMPFNETTSVPNRVIRAGIYLQNKYLIQTTAVTIQNIKRLDWVVPNQTDTFQAIVLNATVPNTENNLFTSIEIGMMDNRAHLLTTKTILEEAKRWVDTFVMTMMNRKETPEFWEERTGFNKPPESLDRPIVSDAQLAYAQFLDQTITPLVGESMEDSGAKQAPTRRSYSRVVYGKSYGNNNSSHSNNTQDTEVSTITSAASNASNNALLRKDMKMAVQNMEELAEKGQKEMRQSLLEEMRQIKDDHTSRTSKIEESMEIFDHMVRELHESNKAKSLEMALYQKKLSQIGQTTAHTATKVDDLADSMNNKVDKLSLTMKAFINVMADTMTGAKDEAAKKKQQQNLLALAELLENDAPTRPPDGMDLEVPLEEDMESDDVNVNNEEPSPDTQGVLGGEGNKK